MFLLLMTAVLADKFVLKQVGIGENENPIFDSQENKIAALFPLLLLMVVIVMVLVDFLAIGVMTGSLSILVIGIIFQILPLDWKSAFSMIIIGVILIYKIGS